MPLGQLQGFPSLRLTGPTCQPSGSRIAYLAGLKSGHAMALLPPISAASYHIYLFHRIVPELLGLDAIGPTGILASIAVGLISGIGAAALQRRLLARMGSVQPRLPRAARLLR